MKYLAIAALGLAACAGFAQHNMHQPSDMDVRLAEMNVNSSDPEVRARAFWVLADSMRAEDPVPMEKAGLAKPAPMKVKKKGRIPDMSQPVSMSFLCDNPDCEPGAHAHYKVYADGRYYLFGCQESAELGRQELTEYGFIAGSVQHVIGNHTL